MHSNSSSEKMNKMTEILANWLKPFDFEEAANGSPVHLVFAEKVLEMGLHSGLPPMETIHNLPTDICHNFLTSLINFEAGLLVSVQFPACETIFGRTFEEHK